MEVITLDESKEKEEDEDEEIDEEENFVEVKDEIKTIKNHMENEIERMMDLLESKLSDQKPSKKCISPKEKTGIQPQPQIHPKQKTIAQELLKMIQKSQPEIGKFKYFDFFTIVPMFKSLGKKLNCLSHRLQVQYG
jgi:hypothetical protein